MPSSRACSNGDHDRCNGWWHVFGWKQDRCLCNCHTAPRPPISIELGGLKVEGLPEALRQAIQRQYQTILIDVGREFADSHRDRWSEPVQFMFVRNEGRWEMQLRSLHRQGGFSGAYYIDDEPSDEEGTPKE